MKIEVKNVSKDFKKVNILHDLNLTFEEGHIYGLVGRNGSGKSVFLKMLCGFYEPTSGTILVDGVDIVKEKTFPKDTRAMIEKPNFLPDFSGFENLKLLANIQRKIGDKEILATLETVDLLPEKDKKFKQYSLGMKQKLGIAQVLMEDPTVIILDEPFNGIDHKSAEKLRKILIEEKKRGKLILLSTHIQDDIDQLADTIYEFDGGEIVPVKKGKKKVSE